MKCFECGREGHKKWECPNIKRRKQKEVALPQKVWEKVKRHSGTRGLPPRGVAMCIEGWTTPREVVTFVEYRGCNYRGIKTEENRGQGFLQYHKRSLTEFVIEEFWILKQGRISNKRCC